MTWAQVAVLFVVTLPASPVVLVALAAGLGHLGWL